jgi:hypothetical protein
MGNLKNDFRAAVSCCFAACCSALKSVIQCAGFCGAELGTGFCAVIGMGLGLQAKNSTIPKVAIFFMGMKQAGPVDAFTGV